MTDYQAIREAPFLNLDYFTHWGARPWQKFIDIGVKTYLGEDLTGKRLLEIGPGRGRMTSLFAILGADVTAVEIDEKRIEQSRQEVKNFGVSDKVDLILYNGDLKTLDQKQYDIIFTKSSLLYPPDLKGFLADLRNLLQDEGKFVFIENARGNTFIQLLRFFKRRSFSFFKRTRFFTRTEIDLVKSIFKVELLMHSKWPPVYLICGTKGREESGAESKLQTYL